MKKFFRELEKPSFLKILKTIRVKLIEYIFHHKNLRNRMIEGSINRKNNRKKPPLDIANQILKHIEYRSYNELKK